MLYPKEIAVGLKEWDCVCKALMQGRQIMILRKGGIHESGGEFELEFKRFLLFPTFLHQDKSLLKPDAHDLFILKSSEPQVVQISAFADVEKIIRIENEEQVKALDQFHVWTEKMVQSRLDYRPDNPLYVLLLNVFLLNKMVEIDYHSQYEGCKSWVGLRRMVDVSDARAVLDVPTRQNLRDEIMMRLQATLPSSKQYTDNKEE